MARKTGSHSEITGPLVRKAAQDLIARHGFAAVTMRQIAAEVGIQAGALYRYTPDKQTLLFDIMQTHLSDLLAAWGQVAPTNGAMNQLEAFVRFHIGYHLDRPNEVFIANMELRNLEKDNFNAIENLRREYEDVLKTILVNGQNSEDFKFPDLKLAVMAILAMLTGVNTWYREDGRLSRERVEKIYWNMVRRILRA